MFAEIKSHLQTHKFANVFDLSKRFNMEPCFIKAMLDDWAAKGKVKACDKLPGCGSRCTKCDLHLTEVYEWVG